MRHTPRFGQQPNRQSPSQTGNAAFGAPFRSNVPQRYQEPRPSQWDNTFNQAPYQGSFETPMSAWQPGTKQRETKPPTRIVLLILVAVLLVAAGGVLLWKALTPQTSQQQVSQPQQSATLVTMLVGTWTAKPDMYADGAVLPKLSIDGASTFIYEDESRSLSGTIQYDEGKPLFIGADGVQTDIHFVLLRAEGPILQVGDQLVYFGQ